MIARPRFWFKTDGLVLLMDSIPPSPGRAVLQVPRSKTESWYFRLIQISTRFRRSRFKPSKVELLIFSRKPAKISLGRIIYQEISIDFCIEL